MMGVAMLTTLSPSWCQTHTVCLGDSSFLIQYDTALLIAKAVEWILRPSDIGKTKREASWRFAQDSRLHAPQARHEDYTNSGYDRGHMMPAGDRSSRISSMKSTFIMTNVCPQVPALNRGPWKRIEEATRRYAAGGHVLRVQAFPIFWKADTFYLNSGRVAIPHGFIKTVRLAYNDSIIYSGYFQNY